jgi:hypothetical protein
MMSKLEELNKKVLSRAFLTLIERGEEPPNPSRNPKEGYQTVSNKEKRYVSK